MQYVEKRKYNKIMSVVYVYSICKCIFLLKAMLSVRYSFLTYLMCKKIMLVTLNVITTEKCLLCGFFFALLYHSRYFYNNIIY